MRMIAIEPIKTFPALPVNHRVFQKIDSHQKAYLLGFLLADGCVLLPRPGRSRSRVNLRIKAGGTHNTRMTVRFKYDVVGKVLAHQLSDANLVQTVQEAGFRKLTLVDSYGHAWYWEF